MRPQLNGHFCEPRPHLWGRGSQEVYAHYVGDDVGAGVAECPSAAQEIQAKTKSFPWWLIFALSPFNTTLHEMLEMRYLWQQPIRMDNAKPIDFLGYEPHTPLIEAVHKTLTGLGCIQHAPETPS